LYLILPQKVFAASRKAGLKNDGLGCVPLATGQGGIALGKVSTPSFLGLVFDSNQKA